MAHSCSLTFRIKELGQKHTISGEFSDEEWATLEDYVLYAHELADTTVVREGLDSSMTVSWTEGSDLHYETKLPEREVLDAFLHRFRPLWLQDEPTSFYRIYGLLAKKLSDPSFLTMIAPLRDLYNAEKATLFKFKVSAGETELNSDQLLRRWLNAYEYHRDRDKRQFFEQLQQLLPLDAAKVLFIGLLGDKTHAILELAKVARLVLGQQTELRSRIPQGVEHSKIRR